MARVLNASESDDVRTIVFSIYEEPVEPTELSVHGVVRFEDPEDGCISYLRRIGLFKTNSDAQKAAEKYADEKGVIIDKWQIDPGEHRGSEPDLFANAKPIVTT